MSLQKYLTTAALSLALSNAHLSPISAEDKNKKSTIDYQETQAIWVNSPPLNMNNLQGIVLLDFWAEWCGPCVKSMPKIKKLSQEYKNKITVIGICKAKDINLEGKYLEKYIHKKRMTFPNVIDDGKWYKKFDVTSMPTYVIVYKNHPEKISYEHISEKIEELIRKN